MKDKELEQQLDCPIIPNDLEASIRSNWKTQLGEPNQQRRWNTLLASAASLVMVVALFASISRTPAVVSDALADIGDDAKHDIGISIPMETLLAEKHFNAPKQSMQTKMTKYCNLNSARTVHLQVAGEKQGQVHLFIQEGAFDVAAWQKNRGVLGTMTWKLITPREDISVLVMYTADMNPDNVEKLIQQMFYV